MNPKWIIDVNVKPETIKPLQEKIRKKKLCNLGLGKDFLGHKKYNP